MRQLYSDLSSTKNQDQRKTSIALLKKCFCLVLRRRPPIFILSIGRKKLKYV